MRRRSRARTRPRGTGSRGRSRPRPASRRDLRGDRVRLLAGEGAVGDEPPRKRAPDRRCYRRLVFLAARRTSSIASCSGKCSGTPGGAMMLPCAERRYICDRRASAPPRSRTLHRCANGLVDLEWIAPVDRHARHAERPRFHREVLARRAVRVFLLGAVCDVVAVVLHDVDDGELPERGDVQGLVERALLRGAVPEEAEHDLPLAADLGGPGGARAVRDARADDPRGAEEAFPASVRCIEPPRPLQMPSGGRRSRPSSPSGRCRGTWGSRGSDRS